MRTIELLVTTALGAAGCAKSTPPAAASDAAVAVAVAPSAVDESVRDPALSGVVQRQVVARGGERYVIVASARERRQELAGTVKVERRDAAPFTARLALKDVLHDADPWTLRVEISRFDDDVALPLLTIGETVGLVPVVHIPWLDRAPERCGASDVVPRNR